MRQPEMITEEKIFSAATEVFAEKGMTGARMQDIADRAGINKSLLHYYYRSKDKLFKAVFDKLAETMFLKFASILGREIPFEEKIAYFFSEHISFLQKNPNLPLFIITEVARDPGLLKKFISSVNIQAIGKTLKPDLNPGITETEITHLMVTVVSMSVFPVLARPVVEAILEQQGIDYDTFLEERKVYSPHFVAEAIRKD
jgi:AcrR family transcriptional regulator